VCARDEAGERSREEGKGMVEKREEKEEEEEFRIVHARGAIPSGKELGKSNGWLLAMSPR
jgi:hypothetical protein